MCTPELLICPSFAYFWTQRSRNGYTMVALGEGGQGLGALEAMSGSIRMSHTAGSPAKTLVTFQVDSGWWQWQSLSSLCSYICCHGAHCAVGDLDWFTRARSLGYGMPLDFLHGSVAGCIARPVTGRGGTIESAHTDGYHWQTGERAWLAWQEATDYSWGDFSRVGHNRPSPSDGRCVQSEVVKSKCE